MKPRSPSAIETKNGKSELRPQDYNPELAEKKMVEGLIEKMGSPTVVSREFVVYHGIWKALNHTRTKRTGYDCSLRLELYEHVGKESVNIDGRYFEKVWAFFLKPTYVLQGMPSAQNAFSDDDRPTLFRRIIDKLRGGSTNGQNNTH